MSSMVLRWSTSKIVFSDPDLGSKWPPSADIVLTKLPNSEQSYKGKVQTHNYINRQNQSTTGNIGPHGKIV